MTPTLLPSPSLPGAPFLAALRDLLGDPRVAVPFFGRPATASMIDRYLLRAQAGAGDPCDAFMFALGPQESLLGAASLFGGKVSFFVAPAHWGRGIAHALVAGLCARGDGAHRGQLLTAMVYRENIRSRSVLEAAGFTFGGLHACGAAAHAGRAALRYERRPGIDRVDPPGGPAWSPPSRCEELDASGWTRP
jgi:RimJ/RimL family protein N-acetyltransferase